MRQPYVIGFCALHYGKPYLSWAIRSVIEQVSLFYVAYSPHGSHGHTTDAVCPDTENELHVLAEQAAGRKLIWYTGDWTQENQQRDSIYEHAPDADLILTADSDELWRSDVLARSLRMAWEGDTRQYLVRELPFWRSFWYAMPDNPLSPTRIVNTRHENRSTILNSYFVHMGYAQPDEYIRYKMQIHGHKNEWRQDVDWYKERWSEIPSIRAVEKHMPRLHMRDLHPCNIDFWNAQRVDPLRYMPEFMTAHPDFVKDMIR